MIARAMGREPDSFSVDFAFYSVDPLRLRNVARIRPVI